MKPHIDFKECLKDSPKFRESLEDSEVNIDMLENRMDKLVKLCSTMIETGKMYSNATNGFISGIRDMAAYFEDDRMTNSCLNKFAAAMTEMQKYYTILLDQAYRSVCKNLTNFIRNDIRKVKENRKHFEKISDDMDAALYKNSQTPRSKTQECDETNNVLTAMKSCFHHTALDYVFRLNVLHSEKRFGILETMLSFMHAQNTYFHQGNDLFADLESYMKSIAAQVEDLTAKSAIERKEMEDRHSLVQTNDIRQPTMTIELEDNGVPLEGYLFKRTSNAFKSWVRRWFTIVDRQLVYRKRSKDSVTVMEDDLRLCNVKPVFDTERRCCFELVSPSRVHMLQADTEVECMAWINAIQSTVNKAFADSHHSHSEEDDSTPTSPIHQPGGQGNGDTATPQSKQSKSQLRRDQILSIPGNSVCCDCSSDAPSWASINLGITLCIECSGIHRSLGVHFSKVRSITLDAWEPELLKVMAEMGNDIVNKIHEAKLDDTIATKATMHSTREEREKWIRAKYVQRAFVTKLPGASDAKSSSVTKIRSWSVCRKKKKSPSKTLYNKPELSICEDQGSDEVASGLMEAVLSVSTPVPNNNDDSGFETGAPDVMVFGTEVRNPDLTRSFDLDSSEESADEEDTTSTTSWEDVSKLDPDTLLFKAAQARNLPVMLEALAHRANINWSNRDDNGKTPLIKAVETGSLAACEFLLLNGASLEKGDGSGRTPLHHATHLGHTGQVCQFLKRGAKQTAVDNDGLDPLSIAVNAANADIVTLLRLAKLNEEMKETEGAYQQGDDTFNDVFRDFTNMATNNPEKLIRK